MRLEVVVMKDSAEVKGLSKEEIEKIKESVKSGLNVLYSNEIGHQVILNEIRKRMEPIVHDLPDEKIHEMSEQDFMDLIDERTGVGEEDRIKYHYEKQNATCKVGEIFRNLNGRDYRVLEKYSDHNMLFQDVKSGALIVGIDVGFFRKLPKATEEMVNKAKEIINDYCIDEFGHDADFTEYPLVQLGYSEDTLDDGKDEYHSIEAYADLENYKLITKVDGKTVGIEQYKSMDDFIEYALDFISFDSLVSLSEDELKVARGEKKMDTHMSEIFIEWGHGRYLSGIPSEIDFAGLKREFGKEMEPDSRGEFDIEIREVLSRTESVKAGYYGEAVDKIMDKYKKGEIVLDAEDFKEVDYLPVQKNDSR